MATRKSKGLTALDVLKAVPAICGACIHCKERGGNGEEWHECFRYPPQLVPDPEEGVISAHPIIEPGDAACGEFKAKQ